MICTGGSTRRYQSEAGSAGRGEAGFAEVRQGPLTEAKQGLYCHQTSSSGRLGEDIGEGTWAFSEASAASTMPWIVSARCKIPPTDAAGNAAGVLARLSTTQELPLELLLRTTLVFCDLAVQLLLRSPKCSSSASAVEESCRASSSSLRCKTIATQMPSTKEKFANEREKTASQQRQQGCQQPLLAAPEPNALWPHSLAVSNRSHRTKYIAGRTARS